MGFEKLIRPPPSKRERKSLGNNWANGVSVGCSGCWKCPSSSKLEGVVEDLANDTSGGSYSSSKCPSSSKLEGVEELAIRVSGGCYGS